MGVVATNVDANCLYIYTSGIINNSTITERNGQTVSCSGSKYNHGVSAVGWGHDEETNQDYYIVKNSWGADWGESGYFRVAAVENTVGVLGIQLNSVIPITD